MKTYVIDASVAAKWVLPAGRETLSQEALELLKRYAAGEVRFVVPDLFWAELANILWKAIRHGRIRTSTAETGASRHAGAQLSYDFFSCFAGRVLCDCDRF